MLHLLKWFATIHDWYDGCREDKKKVKAAQDITKNKGYPPIIVTGDSPDDVALVQWFR